MAQADAVASAATRNIDLLVVLAADSSMSTLKRLLTPRAACDPGRGSGVAEPGEVIVLKFRV